MPRRTVSNIQTDFETGGTTVPTSAPLVDENTATPFYGYGDNSTVVASSGPINQQEMVQAIEDAAQRAANQGGQPSTVDGTYFSSMYGGPGGGSGASAGNGASAGGAGRSPYANMYIRNTQFQPVYYSPEPFRDTRAEAVSEMSEIIKDFMK